MKALEKDRGRRYETATGLAQDIQRYLNDEPVAACPPSTAYRVMKSLRKHRVAALCSGLVLASLLLGLVTTTWQASVASKSLRREREAHSATETQKRRAERAEARAQKRFELAQAAVRTYLDRVTDDPQLNEADFYDLRRKLLESAKPFYDQLDAESAEPGLVEDRGHFFLRLANVLDELGQHDSARNYYQAGLEEFERLVTVSPGNPPYRRLVAGAHNDLALVLISLGQFATARGHHGSAIAIREQLVAELEGMPAWYQARSELVESYLNFGALLAGADRQQEAQEHYEKATTLAEQLVTEQPESSAYRRLLSGAHNNLMNLQRRAGNCEAAQMHGEQAVQIRRQLQQEHAGSPYYADEAAAALHNLGVVLLDAKQFEAAQTKFFEGIRIQESLVNDFPEIYTYRRKLARSQSNLADCFAEMGELAEAQQHFEIAIELQDTLAESGANAAEEHGAACHHLGNVLRDQGKLEPALAHYDRSEQILAESLRRPNQSSHSRQRMANLLLDRAQTLEALQRHVDAIHDWEQLAELVSPEQRAGIRTRVALARVRAGNVIEGVHEATELADRASVAAETLYNCACVLAVAAGKTERVVADEYAAQAIRLLSRAKAAGLFNEPGSIAYLEQDPDLAVLRQRADFRKLYEGNKE